MSEKRFKAQNIINNHVLFATGAGAIPVPLLDFAGVTAVQLDMLKRLTNLYDNNYSDNIGKAFIASLSSTSIARMGASAMKAIPVVGQLIGGFSMSIMSGASTYALGNVILQFMERGIGLDDFDEEMARKIYKENLEKGKQVVEDLKKQGAEAMEDNNAPTFPEDAPEVIIPNTPNNPPVKVKPENDVYAELMKLGTLKEKGIINEEEFKKMKKDIIDKF